MKKRYIYTILFGLPGLVMSGLISFLVSGFTAGVLWIFVFGDNPWPAYVEQLLPLLLGLVFLFLWLASLGAGFVVGKNLEKSPNFNKKHVWISVALTLLPILLMIIYQFNVDNLGPKSDSARCMDYCSQKGYSASSLSPRDSAEHVCGCLDKNGLEGIRVPLESIELGK